MPTLTADTLKDIFRKKQANDLKIAIEELHDIYQDNWEHLIQAELYDQFSYKEYSRLKFLKTQEINLLKRVVNETSLVYKTEPQRMAVLESKTNEDGVEVITEDENYKEAMEYTCFNVLMQEVNKYTNLDNNLLVKTVYRNGKLDFDVITFDNCDIITDPDDWKKIIAVKYYVGLELPKKYAPVGSESDTEVDYQVGNEFKKNRYGMGMEKYSKAYLYTLEDVAQTDIIESETKNTATIKSGYIYELRQIGDQEEIVSKEPIPYKDVNGNVILPFVLFSKSYPVLKLLDFTTGNDMRDLNMNVAITLVHINALMKYQSYKQMVMKVKDKSDIPENFRMGPAEMAIIGDPDGNADLSVLDIQSRIDYIWDIIKQRILTSLSQYGISPQNYELSGTPSSGFAIMLSNLAKLEYRQAQLPLYRKYEEEMFNVIRSVWNYHNQDKMISESAEFVIDFADILFPRSPDEIQKDFLFRKQNNAATDIDLILELNPDLDKETAKRQWIENKAFNEAAMPKVAVQPAQRPTGAPPLAGKLGEKEK